MDDKLTTKQAITVIGNLKDWLYFSSMNGGTSIQREAIDMAIKALEQPEIVRCEECKYHYQRNCPIEKYFSLNGFCSRGKRREVTE